MQSCHADFQSFLPVTERNTYKAVSAEGGAGDYGQKVTPDQRPAEILRAFPGECR